jgi:protein-L-isoaspartate(D-aspartate) O-methyltransferase
MSDLAEYRRFFAEELEAVARLQTRALVDALAAVPRERFLRPGPWTVFADADVVAGGSPQTRTTPDADPRRVYHNIAVAIDPSRQLFNGQPGTLLVWLDALALMPGARVLHIGCGLGYYTAIIAHAVGPEGGVVAYEVDQTLAADARRNLGFIPWVSVRHGDASTLDAAFDAVLVNAGMTHPPAAWLDALVPAGRMILPLTGTMPAMGTSIGKGIVYRLTKREDGDCDAGVVGFVAIFSAVGLRDEALNAQLGRALMGGPGRWQAVKRLRRGAHEPDGSCWFHGPDFCFSSGNPA